MTDDFQIKTYKIKLNIEHFDFVLCNWVTTEQVRVFVKTR